MVMCLIIRMKITKLKKWMFVTFIYKKVRLGFGILLRIEDLFTMEKIIEGSMS